MASAVNRITFGGIDIGSVSPHFVLIDEQIGPVERRAITQDPPLADGQYFGGLKNGIRTATYTFAILDDNDVSRAQAVRRLNAIVAGRTPKVLQSPRLNGDYLNAVCTGFPSPSALEWAGELTVQFTAFDPFIYSEFDDLDMALTAGGNTDVYVNCSGSMRPTITQAIGATITDPTWACSNGQTIMLQGTVAAGTLVIDCVKREITHTADASIMAKLSLDSRFFDLEPNAEVGALPYTFTCSNGAAGQITGKNRWL